MGKFDTVSKVVNYFVKPGKSILINSKVQSLEKYHCKLEMVQAVDKAGKIVETEIPTAQTLADLGDASLWIESALKSDLPVARQEIQNIFGNLSSVENVMNRAKGALSIQPKLLKGLKKSENKTFNNINEAIQVIGDGIGSRVITKSLDKLSKKEIDNMIAKMTFEGEELTSKQKDLLTRYIYQKPIPPKDKETAFKLFERFAQPLVEKRSREVVDTLTLGILKERMVSESLDIKQIKELGLCSDDLLEKLIKDSSIQPIKITEINNYRGAHGLAEFSNNQISQLYKALNYKRVNGKPVIVHSDPKGLGWSKYSSDKLNELNDAKYLKASGYRTAQMNVVHSNGALGEIQFRGKYTNMIGEYEHIAYDLRQGKGDNTLGPIFDDYKNAVLKLDDKEYTKYNEYLESCYNYYNRLELGLPAVKPKLPPKFNKILSEDNMRRLHDEDGALQKELNKGFIPYIQNVA